MHEAWNCRSFTRSSDWSLCCERINHLMVHLIDQMILHLVHHLVVCLWWVLRLRLLLHVHVVLYLPYQMILHMVHHLIWVLLLTSKAAVVHWLLLRHVRRKLLVPCLKLIRIRISIRQAEDINVLCWLFFQLLVKLCQHIKVLTELLIVCSICAERVYSMDI